MKKAKIYWSSNKKEILAFVILLLIIVFVTGFPYLKGGVSGYEPDLMYHLLRIEGVKEALLQGQYPVRIYNNFFAEYGYGSPLFYPDIFLIIPAIFRIIGLSPIITWKVFSLLVAAIATVTTYYSYKYICENWKMALCGTTLLMLSQFYLADLQNRIGLSEYIAYIFIPILIAGIYDFFAKDGKKVYLMGIAFLGLVLSHTIMTFIGVVITAIVFIIMLFLPSERKYIFCKEKMIGLLVTALCTILLAAYYLLPMLEQMTATVYKYKIPWANVGKYTQPLSVLFKVTGYFDNIAYVGIGIPIILLIGCRFFLNKPKNKWANIFYFGGLFMFIITTKLFPWKVLSETVFNMIQFTYRFYPYALCFLVLGIIIIFSEHYGEHVPQKVMTFILLSAILFGAWQNYTIIQRDDNIGVTEEKLIENSSFVGKGEWLPVKTGKSISELDSLTDTIQDVICDEEKIKFDREYNGGNFEINSEEELIYNIPLIYYKGYVAQIETEDGQKIELQVSESDNGMVEVKNTSGFNGTISVKYVSTIIQNISLAISCATLLGIVVLLIKRSLKT